MKQKIEALEALFYDSGISIEDFAKYSSLSIDDIKRIMRIAWKIKVQRKNFEDDRKFKKKNQVILKQTDK